MINEIYRELLLTKEIPMLDWEYLSRQEWALPLLLENSDEILDWKYLSRNEWALPLLLEHFDKNLDWIYLSHQEWALPLLEENLDKIDWYQLFCTSWIYTMINEWDHFINLQPLFVIHVCQYISMNSVLCNALRNSRKELHEDLIAYIHQPRSNYKWALQLLMENSDKNLNWKHLSKYEWVLPLLLENSEKGLNWDYLSECEWAFPLLEANLDKVKWSIISKCEWALPLLMEHLDMVNWNILLSQEWIYDMADEWRHPIFSEPLFLIHACSCFDMNEFLCDTLRLSRENLHEDLIAYIHHPRFIEEHISFGFDVESYEYPHQHLWSHVVPT